MKKQFIRMAATLGTCLVLASCGGGGDSIPWMTVSADGATSIQAATLTASLSALPLEEIQSAESVSLTYMREEEKLAHDVYAQLDQLWGISVRVLGNIAASEATHTEAIRLLLQRYALTDPAENIAEAVFQNADLQQLYERLVAQGSTSMIEALKVGAAIEEIDMFDIQADLPAIDNQDITLVYENLLKGSRNHLRAFVSVLSAQGVSYVPQYLSEQEYQAIIDGPMER